MDFVHVSVIVSFGLRIGIKGIYTRSWNLQRYAARTGNDGRMEMQFSLLCMRLLRLHVRLLREPY